MKNALLLLGLLWCCLAVSAASAYELVAVELTHDDIMLTFDEQLKQPLGQGVVMNVYVATAPYTCALTEAQYMRFGAIVEKRTAAGWQYTLDRRGYDRLCYVDVFADWKPPMQKFWINGYDGTCTFEDLINSAGSDCDDKSGSINPTKAWWSDKAGAFFVALDGSYAGDATLKISFQTDNGVSTMSVPLTDPTTMFVKAGLGPEEHCGEEALVSVASPQEEVVSSKRLRVECTEQVEVPVCGNLICEYVEDKSSCAKDCENPFNENLTFTPSYHYVSVSGRMSFPGETCGFRIEGPGMSLLAPGERATGYRYRTSFTQAFSMGDNVSGNYAFSVVCPSSESRKIPFLYCDNCQVEGRCLSEGESLGEKYCSRGKMLYKLPEGYPCSAGYQCKSEVCAKGNFCMPEKPLSRLWWRLTGKKGWPEPTDYTDAQE